jgi:hypothetical protein
MSSPANALIGEAELACYAGEMQRRRAKVHARSYSTAYRANAAELRWL